MKEKTVAVLVAEAGDRAAAVENCLYWVFEMTAYNEPYTRDFYMVTLYRDHDFARTEPTRHLHAGFFTSSAEALRAIRDNSFSYAPLVLPWATFERAGRALLSGEERQHIFRYNGRLERESKNTILYTTTCGIEYRISTNELEALLT